MASWGVLPERCDRIMKTAETSLEHMKKKQEEQNQGKILEQFFDELKSYNMWGGFLIAAIIMDTIAGIFMCFPYQELLEDRGILGLGFMFGLNGALYYMLGYDRFTEKGQNHSLYERIKHHPVSKISFYKWQMKKLIRYCTKRTCVFLGLQLFFTLVCIRHFTWGNFLYPLLIGFVIPVGIFSIPYYIKVGEEV